MINRSGGEDKIGEVGLVAKSSSCNPGDLTHDLLEPPRF